mmetsp:Transcript_8010/g.17934  ORF Transcript_8010/g.17934 Transcript_8010/m.17934 type:complete len:255 (+) Transcript_8010:65-829(+)
MPMTSRRSDDMRDIRHSRRRRRSNSSNSSSTTDDRLSLLLLSLQLQLRLLLLELLLLHKEGGVGGIHSSNTITASGNHSRDTADSSCRLWQGERTLLLIHLLLQLGGMILHRRGLSLSVRLLLLHTTAPLGIGPVLLSRRRRCRHPLLLKAGQPREAPRTDADKAEAQTQLLSNRPITSRGRLLLLLSKPSLHLLQMLQLGGCHGLLLPRTDTLTSLALTLSHLIRLHIVSVGFWPMILLLTRRQLVEHDLCLS